MTVLTFQFLVHETREDWEGACRAYYRIWLRDSETANRAAEQSGVFERQAYLNWYEMHRDAPARILQEVRTRERA